MLIRRINLFLIFIILTHVFALVSCRHEEFPELESGPDISLNNTHCIISEPDQEPIVLDAESFDIFTDDDIITMRNVNFKQYKKDSVNPNITGFAAILSINSKTQDVELSGGVKIFIYPDKEEKDKTNYDWTDEIIEENSIDSELIAEKIEEKPDTSENLDEETSSEDVKNVEINSDNEEQNIETKIEKINKIEAKKVSWGKYTKTLTSEAEVLLEWENTLIRGRGFRGNLNTGEFSFDQIFEGKL